MTQSNSSFIPNPSQQTIIARINTTEDIYPGLIVTIDPSIHEASLPHGDNYKSVFIVDDIISYGLCSCLIPQPGMKMYGVIDTDEEIYPGTPLYTNNKGKLVPYSLLTTYVSSVSDVIVPVEYTGNNRFRAISHISKNKDAPIEQKICSFCQYLAKKYGSLKINKDGLDMIL